MKIPLFDLDDTLLATNDEISQGDFRYAFNKVYGIDAGKNDVKTEEGRISNQIFLEVLKFHGFSEDQILPKLNQAKEALTEHFFESAKNYHFIVLPGAKNLLIAIKDAGGTSGILTGNNQDVAQYKLESTGLSDYIEFGAYGHEAALRTELVEIARKRAERRLAKPVNKNDLVIIGDTPNDLRTAHETGIKVIAVSSGMYTSKELEEKKPDLLVGSLEEKDRILDFLRS